MLKIQLAVIFAWLPSRIKGQHLGRNIIKLGIHPWEASDKTPFFFYPEDEAVITKTGDFHSFISSYFISELQGKKKSREFSTGGSKESADGQQISLETRKVFNMKLVMRERALTDKLNNVPC